MPRPSCAQAAVLGIGGLAFACAPTTHSAPAAAVPEAPAASAASAAVAPLAPPTADALFSAAPATASSSSQAAANPVPGERPVQPRGSRSPGPLPEWLVPPADSPGMIPKGPPFPNDDAGRGNWGRTAEGTGAITGFSLGLDPSRDPKFAVSQLKTTGDLGRVRPSVNSAVTSLRMCMADERTVVVLSAALDVQTDGSVTKARLTPARPAAKCVERILSVLEFPKAEAKYGITFKLEMTPAK